MTLDELLRHVRISLRNRGPDAGQLKRFLISVKRGEPDWAVLDLPDAKDLPAVQWKLRT